MLSQFKKIAGSMVLLTMTQVTYANPNDQHIVVAPSCLLKQITVTPTSLATGESLTLFATDNKGIDQLIAAKHHQKTACGGFMDVTHEWQAYSKQQPLRADRAYAFLQHYTDTGIESLKKHKGKKDKKYSIKYNEQVVQLSKQLNPDNMWKDLTTLTHFKDRYANSDTGVKAAQWLKTQVETIAAQHHRDDVTAYFVSTGERWKQPSLVVKVGNSKEAGVVIGGHMDTLSSNSWGNKPGADDDGTGTVTVLEIARTVLSSDMRFKKPIYFIWYSAEEMGLIGSQYVVKDFQNRNIPVDAVMQLDMTGFAYQNEPTMWLMKDHVNANLTTFVATLIDSYVKKPVKYSKCGYGCSDHASWDNAGIAAVMPFETQMGYENPDIHSSQDTMDNLSLSHMTDYLNLGTAFAVELAEPVA